MINKKSNIAVFSLAFSPFEGGAEVAIREIAVRLPDFNFFIFTYKFNKNWLSKERRDNMEIIRLGRGRSGERYYGRIWNKIFYIFNAWQEAERAHKEARIEMIWAVMASYGAIAALLFKFNHPSIPFLLTIQEGDSEGHLNFGRLGLVGFFGRLAMRSADYVQVISAFLRDFVRKRGVACPVEVIPNGVDLDIFGARYTLSEIKAIRSNLGVKDEYVVITTSRLVYKNGIDVLIEAIAEFKKRRPNIKCLIIGDGPEYKKLKAKSEKLKVDGNVLFLGQVLHKDLPLYLKISDVFVRPSRSEGLGNSFLEAMAAGVPVVGTPVGGIIDFLRDEETGLYMAVDDYRDLSDKISRVIGDPDLRKKVVCNASALVKENYSWDRVSKLFRNIFNKLINE